MKKCNLYQIVLLGLLVFATCAAPTPAETKKLHIIVCAEQMWDYGLFQVISDTYKSTADVEFALNTFNGLNTTTGTVRLNAADLVVIGRSCSSTNYAGNATLCANWNGLTCPILTTNQWILRGDRWGAYNCGTTSPDGRSDTWSNLVVTSATCPIYKGIDVSSGTLKIFKTPQIFRYYSNQDMSQNNGSVYGKATTGNSASIVFWRGGKPYYNGTPVSGTAYTPAANRLLVAFTDDYNRPAGSTTDSINQWQDSVTPEARLLLQNALNMMLPVPPIPNAVKSAATFE